MSEILFLISESNPKLESSICTFAQNEFDAQAQFKNMSTGELHKGKLTDTIWQALVIIATIEGSLQFSERVQRMEHVQKLLDAVKEYGKSVYMRLEDKEAIDISKLSVDDIMNLFANHAKEKKSKDKEVK